MADQQNTPSKGESNGCGCGCPPCATCFYEAETARAPSPEVSELLAASEALRHACDVHLDRRALLTRERNKARAERDSLRAALAKAGPRNNDLLAAALAESSGRLHELNRLEKVNRENWTRAMAAEAKLAKAVEAINTLFAKIEHGAEDHRAWLRAALDEHFAALREPAVDASEPSGKTGELP